VWVKRLERFGVVVFGGGGGELQSQPSDRRYPLPSQLQHRVGRNLRYGVQRALAETRRLLGLGAVVRREKQKLVGLQRFCRDLREHCEVAQDSSQRLFFLRRLGEDVCEEEQGVCELLHGRDVSEVAVALQEVEGPASEAASNHGFSQRGFEVLFGDVSEEQLSPDLADLREVAFEAFGVLGEDLEFFFD